MENREIKFNCLVIETGIIVHKFYEWHKGDGWGHDFYRPLVTNGVYDDTRLEEFQGIVRRQFIGLTDKNGNEVFEGDRIRYKSNEAGTMNTIDKIFTVSWNDKQACFDLDSNTYGVDVCQYSEVVGNIYEIPELNYK